jgi:hypothetical protein
MEEKGATHLFFQSLDHSVVVGSTTDVERAERRRRRKL